jgi:hypothetical protein
MRYICAVSSLHPIDLAALVTTHAYQPLSSSDQVLLSIVDDSVVPVDPKLRILAPQLSLPLPWLTLDSRGIYRQLFMPLIPHESSTNWLRLSYAADAIHRAVSLGMGASVVPDQRRRVQQLILAGRRHIGNSPSAANVLSFLARYILSIVLPANISSIPYQEMLFSVRGRASTCNAIGNMICYSTLGDEAIAFDKGGYVELRERSGRKFRFHRATCKHGTTLLHADNSPSLLEIYNGAARIGSDKALVDVDTGDCIRLRGPLELALQAEYGDIVHLPWYCSQVTAGESERDINVAETISPITCASPTRTSSWAGGEGHRFQPSGYSLVEYDHPTVAAFVSNVAGVSIDALSELSDWHHYLSNYPSTQQKALKYQGQSSEYCTRRLRELREALKNGEVGPLLVTWNYSRLPLSTSPLRLGSILLAMVATFRYLHEWGRRAPGIVLNDEQLAVLRRTGIVGTDGTPTTGSLHNIIGDLLKASATWRFDTVRQRPAVDLERPKELEHTIDAIAITPEIQLPTLPRAERPTDLREAARLLQNEAESYYQCVLAVCASALKANLWTCWILLGADAYVDAARDLWTRRLTGPLRLSARLWRSA